MSKFPLDMIPNNESVEWFSPAKKSTSPSPLLNGLIGLCVSTSLWFLGWRVIALVGGSITFILTLLSLSSPLMKIKIEQGFHFLGTGFGHLAVWVTLIPIYLTIFPLIRMYDLLTRADPMGRRLNSGLVTYWLPADDPARVKAGITRSFVTEPLSERKGRGIVGSLTLIIFGLVTAELSFRWMGFGDPILYIEDARFGYMPRPNQEVTRRGLTIKINEWGMRAPDFQKRKSEGVQRILMLGDSTLWGGSYTPQNRIYARQVEHLLQSKGYSIEVLNMGVNGWGPEHKLGYIDAYGTFDADLVVVAFPYSDLRRPISYLGMTPFYPAGHPPAFATQEVLYHLSWRLRSELIGPPDQSQKVVRLQRGIEAYARLAEALNERGLEVWFEMLPSRNNVEGAKSSAEIELAQSIQARLSRLSFDLQFSYPMEQLSGAYAQRSDRSTLFHDPGHLNLEGHDVYARYLADRLTKSARLHKRDTTLRGGQQ